MTAKGQLSDVKAAHLVRQLMTEPGRSAPTEPAQAGAVALTESQAQAPC
jgi:hypothetical protein